MFRFSCSIYHRIRGISPILHAQQHFKYTPEHSLNKSQSAAINDTENAASEIRESGNVIATKLNKRKEPWIILMKKQSCIESYPEILRECGIQNAEYHSASYIHILWRTVADLKNDDIIAANLNVPQHMNEHIDGVKLNLNEFRFDDSMRLGTIRYIMLRAYINQLLERSADETHEEFRKKTLHLYHRPLANVHKVFELLTNELGFTKAQLRSNMRILGESEQNVRQLLGTVANTTVDIKPILRKWPKLMQKQWINIWENLQHLKSFGIPEHETLKYITIFCIAPKEVYERLKFISEHELLNKYMNQPKRVVDMVVFFKRVLLRLECMKIYPKREISISCLIHATDEIFIRKLTKGDSRSPSTKLCRYFAEFFGRSLEETKVFMEQHPHMFCFSTAYIERNIKLLRTCGFSLNDIFINLYITIYPEDKIKDCLEKINNAAYMSQEYKVNVEELNMLQRLKLCGHMMEIEHNFSGDGCWPDTDADPNDPMKNEEILHEILQGKKLKQRSSETD